uniref:Complex I assembly factor TIMMDC1, mitochondrial n=1 Tax=Sus scrofa TaxID=9823 RepID=A0A8D1YB95_PIG
PTSANDPVWLPGNCPTQFHWRRRRGPDGAESCYTPPAHFRRVSLPPLRSVPPQTGSASGSGSALAQPSSLCPGWGGTSCLVCPRASKVSEQQRTSKELQDIYKAAISAGIIGWAYGGIPAFIHAKQHYIEQSQAEVYHNQFDAVHSAHRAATRGFIRYGWRWSWRTTLFVTIFNTVNTGLNVYRNKNALSHFVIAGAVTGSLFRINLGLHGLVAGGLIGALLGTPIGSLLMAIQKYCGETVQERKEKDRKALQELKLEERKARLQFTELLPEEIESSLQKNQSKDDAMKIETLLNLPRNPSSTNKQD